MEYTTFNKTEPWCETAIVVKRGTPRSKKNETLNFGKIYEQLLEIQLTKDVEALGVSLVGNAFRRFFAQSGLKYTFEDSALKRLSPNGTQYRNSEEFYGRISVSAEDKRKWTAAAKFF